jgi:hypothetical protein
MTAAASLPFASRRSPTIGPAYARDRIPPFQEWYFPALTCELGNGVRAATMTEARISLYQQTWRGNEILAVKSFSATIQAYGWTASDLEVGIYFWDADGKVAGRWSILGLHLPCSQADTTITQLGAIDMLDTHLIDRIYGVTYELGAGWWTRCRDYPETRE